MEKCGRVVPCLVKFLRQKFVPCQFECENFFIFIWSIRFTSFFLAPIAQSYTNRENGQRIGRSKEDVFLFQNLITAFFSEVPSAWSHEWMSNASWWIKHVGACADEYQRYALKCTETIANLNDVTFLRYDRSKLTRFRENHSREKTRRRLKIYHYIFQA